MKNSFKNHVYVMLDRSSSMCRIIDVAKDVFNGQIDALREQSLLHDQETRISFYTFAGDVECVISDVDVARPVKLEQSMLAAQPQLETLCSQRLKTPKQSHKNMEITHLSFT